MYVYMYIYRVEPTQALNPLSPHCASRGMAKTRPKLLQEATKEQRADRDFVLKAVAIFETELSTYTPECNSIKGLMVSIRWYLGYLKG